MSMFSFPGYMQNPAANQFQAPPIPGQYGNMAAYFPILQRAADKYRKRAEKRRGRSIKMLRKSIRQDARRLKGTAISRAVRSGLATSSAVGTAAGQAARFKTGAMGEVAKLIAAPPQYEQDPFYQAILQQWLMANQGLIGKGTRAGDPGQGIPWGAIGTMGGALIGGMFGGPPGAAAGGAAGGGALGMFGGSNPGSSAGAIPGSMPWPY